jgi:hypothetical protein
MRTTVDTKYAKVHFCEEFESDKLDDHMVIWANVEFAWTEKANPISKAFGNNMDQRILSKVRSVFADLLKLDSEVINKEIYLEDCDLVVNCLTVETKHVATYLIGIVKQFEYEFDRMLEGVLKAQ